MGEIKLSGIYIYPIKSAAGISLDAAQVTDRGFQYDRRWMVVDETGKFLTQRKFPQMALIKVSLENEQLVINAPNQEPLFISLYPDTSHPINVQVWRSVCDAIPLGEEVRQWFSEFLKIPCQLVYMPDSTHRSVNPDYGKPDDIVSFADGYPFLLISEASLQDLNARLDEPIPMNRFRPNLVVSGCEAFAEDTWRSIQIGAIAFDGVKPCDRCIIPSIDQASGIQGKEPLQTLAKYRRQGGEILFGQNLIQRGLGTLQIGDRVKIVEQ